MSKEYNVAIAGATGAVGIEMIKTLEQRDFPVKNLRLLASARSIGKKFPWWLNYYRVGSDPGRQCSFFHVSISC